MEVKLDLLIAAASAGVLVYSGRLLVPAARLRPEDIIAYKSIPGYSGSMEQGLVYMHFPEDDTLLSIRDVLDAKAGFDLLVFGTIVGVVAIIVGAFTLTWNHPSSQDIALAVVAFAVGLGGGWWWKAHSGWYRRQERRLLARCFLAWLEGAVADWKTKLQDLSLSIVNGARRSGFTLIDEGADDKAIARRVVDLARKNRYVWRSDEIRAWAREVASRSD